MDLKLQVLREEVKKIGKKKPRVKERLLALIALTKFQQKWKKLRDQDYDQVANPFGMSGRTLRRWEKSYLEGGVKGITPKPHPGRKPKPIRGLAAKKIREWRTLYNWGAEVIQAHLELNHELRLSRNRIQRFLNKKGLVRKKCKQKAPRKKHTRIVHVEHPGTHTQTDVKHLPYLLPKAKKCYVYNFVDHALRWSFKRAYDSYGPSETKDFMSRVILAAPFTISRSQTDNGVEFTNKYISYLDDPKPHALDELCAVHGIRHVLVPPGEKELQGLVERSHRQDDEELFHRIKPNNIEEFNKILAQHCEWRNSKRRRKALNWKTSTEFLEAYQEKIKAWLYENQPSPFFSLEKKSEEPNNENVDNDTVKKVA